MNINESWSFKSRNKIFFIERIGEDTYSSISITKSDAEYYMITKHYLCMADIPLIEILKVQADLMSLDDIYTEKVLLNKKTAENLLILGFGSKKALGFLNETDIKKLEKTYEDKRDISFIDKLGNVVK